MKKLILPSLLLCFGILLCVQESLSIPAFARKYKTSCATCHNGFPKLTPFGEAFRRNGYQFPSHTDPQYIKEEPVSLGSEGYKRAFPDAIWPGTIPGSSPISLFLNGEADYNPNEAPKFSFDGFGSSIEAVAGGTLGEDLSFWGQAALNSDGTLELNRIFLIFSNLIGESYAFNLRVGAFEPGLFSFSTHRSWMEDYWLTTRPFSDDMGWTIEEFQKGLEFNGILDGRFAYNAGVVEGFGAPHSGKDFYGHVMYKFGGMRLDGVTENGPTLNNPEPWVDNSFSVGAYFYRGSSVLGPDTGPQSDKFTMAGGDVNAFYDRCNVFGGIGVRNDDQPFVGTIGSSASTTVWFTEVNYVIYPWLLPGIRYESWKSHSDPTTEYTDSQFVPGIVALIRPNLKFILKTTVEKFDSRGDTKFQLGMVSFGIALGI